MPNKPSAFPKTSDHAKARNFPSDAAARNEAKRINAVLKMRKFACDACYLCKHFHVISTGDHFFLRATE